MTRYRQLSHRLILCALLGMTGGCTSLRRVPVTAAPQAESFPGISAGDTVEVETRDGRRIRFVVRQVDGDMLLSEKGDRFSRDELVQLKRQTFSGGKTVLLIGAVVYGAVYTVFALLFSGTL